jgi:hypothetical protein
MVAVVFLPWMSSEKILFLILIFKKNSDLTSFIDEFRKMGIIHQTPAFLNEFVLLETSFRVYAIFPNTKT